MLHIMLVLNEKGLAFIREPFNFIGAPARIELAAHGLGKPTSGFSNLLILRNLLKSPLMQFPHFFTF